MNEIRIDLRSDTITKPNAPMLEAMMSAEVGDDVFEDDVTVNTLESKAAEMFGMESALFCASGTMTNQLAIRVHCAPGSEVICDRLSHVYLYEGGGIALNAFSSVKTIEGDRGRLSAEQVAGAINDPDDIHEPVSKMVSLENTANKGGGSIYDFVEIRKIKDVCEQNSLKLHLDGARLFNAIVETENSPKEFGRIFDSISLCLSKGLGCPIGSLLLGSDELIKKARRFRKVMGGGWRQAGYLAAAGIYALDNNVERLRDDHRRAKSIGEILSQMTLVKEIYPIETNIIIFELQNKMSAAEFVSRLAEKGIYGGAFGRHLVRFVTHLGFNDDHLIEFESRMKKVAAFHH